MAIALVKSAVSRREATVLAENAAKGMIVSNHFDYEAYRLIERVKPFVLEAPYYAPYLVTSKCVNSPLAGQKATFGQENEYYGREMSRAMIFEPCLPRAAVRGTCTPVFTGPAAARSHARRREKWVVQVGFVARQRRPAMADQADF
eukprot:2549165-Pleurochrysis_carterae.AAC.1